MTYVVLDIGAGTRGFGKDLIALNRDVPLQVLCGEPEWGVGPLWRALSPSKAAALLKTGKRGTYRIESSYRRFQLPDSSLDLVTLNAPHAMTAPLVWPIHTELERCLRPGGIFFSSFPAYDMGIVPKNFIQLEKGRWGFRPWWVEIEGHKLPPKSPTRFPQSFTVRDNIFGHRFGNPRARGSSYVYSGGISPGWVLWQKPE